MTPVPPFRASDVNVDARVDRELVFHFGDAGGIAGGALGIPHLGVRAHRAAQDRLVALDLDTDALSVELGAPFQRLPDPLLHVGRGWPRLSARLRQCRHPGDWAPSASRRRLLFESPCRYA